MNEKDLTALFARLGASDPAGWAQSQISEGIPQLARFLFLRQAWAKILSPEDSAWIKEGLERSSTEPGGGIAAALRNVIAAGISTDDLTTIVRVKQWELLTDLCYLLDDPSVQEMGTPAPEWGLFEITGDDQPGQQISGLHESVLETDPTGREMM